MPTYQISAPDGNTYSIDGPAGASQEQVQAEVMRQHPTAGTAVSAVPAESTGPPTPATTTRVTPGGPVVTPVDSGRGNPVQAVGETALHMASQIPAGFAGAAVHVGNQIGLPGNPDTVRNALTIQPESQMGKDLTASAESGFQKEDAFERAHLNPTVKDVTDTGLALAAPFVGLKGASDVTPPLVRPADTAIPGTVPSALPALRAAGYQMRPSDVPARNPSVNPGDVPGSTREALTSNPPQTEAMVRNNAGVSTKLIGEDIGVPDATKLTPAHYAQARLAPGADYDRVGAAVGTVDKPLTQAPATLSSMAQDKSVNAMPADARAQAERTSSGLQSGTYAGPQIIRDISYFRTVPGGRPAAQALEDELGAQVQAKAPQLEGTYENARTTFAKIQNAEDSTTGGIIDATDYRRLGENNPRLLTGNSKLVYQAGGELPGVTRLPRATADQSLIGHTVFETGKNIAGHLLSKVPGVSITSPALQARIAAAAPASGPLPTGPYPRGLPTVGQSDLLGHTLAGDPTNFSLGDIGPEQGMGPRPAPPAGTPGIAPQPATPQQILDQIQLRDAGRPTPQSSPSDIRGSGPVPTEPTGPAPTPVPEPFAGPGPPEGQLPKRLGDYIRHLMERGPAPRGRHGE